MYTIESQAMVNTACQQAERVILEGIILDEEMKLTEDKNLYRTMKEEREAELSRRRKPTVTHLKQELTDLQAKYSDLCDKLDNQTTTINIQCNLQL